MGGDGGGVRVLVDRAEQGKEGRRLPDAELLPAGMYRNRSFAEAAVDVGDTETAIQDLLFDPQTSGGLLMAVAPEDADALIAELQGAVPSVQRIGTVSEYTGGKRILLR